MAGPAEREGDMASFELKEIERRMRGALGVLKQEFGGLRTGRANASLLDPITVMAYGNPMPLNQLATVNVPEFAADHRAGLGPEPSRGGGTRHQRSPTWD